MTEPKTPAQLADDAAEAIRALNHLTRSPGDGFQYPGDVYSVVGNLQTAVMRMPQLFQQLKGLIDQLAIHGNLKSDSDELRLDGFDTAITNAVVLAQDLDGQLRDAQNVLSSIGWQDSPDPLEGYDIPELP